MAPLSEPPGCLPSIQKQQVVHQLLTIASCTGATPIISDNQTDGQDKGHSLNINSSGCFKRCWAVKQQMEGQVQQDREGQADKRDHSGC
ncbi:hypothetical protein AcV7_007207 [Taiwanofungus camphoratus]|nr:hypothetical protein AcV7_007207 [Antrodia cinnamomea]